VNTGGFMTFSAIDILLLVSAMFGVYGLSANGRRRILSCKFFCDVFFALYLYFLGGYTGTMSAGIAALGALIQLASPDKYLGKTLKIRIILAVVLSIAGIAVLARNLTDIYPFISVVVSRFGELSSRTLIIRAGFLTACIPWMIYNYSNEFYLALGFNFLMVIALLTGIVRNERNVKKDQVL